MFNLTSFSTAEHSEAIFYSESCRVGAPGVIFTKLAPCTLTSFAEGKKPLSRTISAHAACSCSANAMTRPDAPFWRRLLVRRSSMDCFNLARWRSFARRLALRTPGFFEYIQVEITK